MQTLVMIPDDGVIHGVIPGIQRPPEICVDYLSHDWKKEDDIWTSWKVMSKQKKEIVNGVRLENASWRTWAKQKYHLNTVNPEKLNWMKDSDVTWLYGPLHTAWSYSKHEEYIQPKSPTLQDKLGLMHHNPGTCQKSCLKKKSISERLRTGENGKRIIKIPSHSDSQLLKKNPFEDKNRSQRMEEDPIYNQVQPLSSSIPKSSSLSGRQQKQRRQENHRIRFNDQVEQYIAVDSAEEEEETEEQLDATSKCEDGHESSGSNSSDDNAISSRSSRKFINIKKKECTTIHKLEPTKLKSDRLHHNEYSALYNNNSKCDDKYDNVYRSNPASSSSFESSSSQDRSSVPINYPRTPPTPSPSPSTNSSIPISTSDDYRDYSNYSTTRTSSSYHWDDDNDLDVMDFVDMGVFTTEMFGHFDPPELLVGSPLNTSNSTIPRSAAAAAAQSEKLSREQTQRGRDNEKEKEHDGLVDKAVILATGVRDIVHWCSTVVFKGQVF